MICRMKYVVQIDKEKWKHETFMFSEKEVSC